MDPDPEHKHEIFLKTFFAETETLWSQGPVTWDFWTSYSIGSRYSTFKHFRPCSASNKTVSSYAQPVMKFVPRMLSQRWNLFCVCLAYCILNVDFEMGWDFPLCWACTKIGYLLAENAQYLVTCWLSMHKNWLLTSWVYAKIISAHHMPILSFPSLIPIIQSYVPFSHLCLTSFVPSVTSLYFVSHYVPFLCLCPLSPVLCPLSHGSALSPALSSRLSSLSSILCILSTVPDSPFCGSVPLFLSFAPLFPVLCHLSFILARMRDFLKKYTVEECRLRWWIFTSVDKSSPP